MWDIPFKQKFTTVLLGLHSRNPILANSAVTLQCYFIFKATDVLVFLFQF